jgi:DNA-directed RNA polymerase I subunit RPA12
MSVVGSLIFCTDCGNLLDSLVDKSKDLVCSQCRKSYPSKNFEDLRVVTRSSDNAFPSTLKSKRSAVKTVLQSDEVGEGAVVCISSNMVSIGILVY